MAFFYEAESPIWKYKERYGDWRKFPKRTATKLEKLWKKVHIDGDISTTEHEWKNDNQNLKINLQTMSATNMASYYRNSEVSREGYPYPNPGNKKKLEQLYKKYVTDVTEGDETFKAFDLETFFNDLGIDGNGIDSIIFLAMCEVENFEVLKAEFVTGLSKCGCTNMDNIREAINPIRATLIDKKSKKVLKSFAKWLFIAAKDDSARTISTTQLAGLLGLMCPSNKFALSEDFVNFLTTEGEKEDGDRKTCSRDDWVMMVEFVADKSNWDGFEDYVEDEGWPLIISDCHDSKKKAEN